MKIYSRDRARRSVFDTIGFRGLSQAATILSYAVLVRSTSEETFGVLNLLYAVIPIVNTFGSLGLDHVLRRFQPEFLQAGRLNAAAWMLRVVRRYRFMVNLLLIGIILAEWQWIAPVFELTRFRADFAIFSILMLVHFQVMILQYAMASYMQHRYSVGSVAILAVGKLVIYAVLALSDEITLRGAIIADLIAYTIAFVFLLRGYRQTQREAGAAAEDRLAPDEIKRLRRYAVFSHFNDAASVLQYNETDRFFIAALLNPIAVGIYAFYTRLCEMATSLIPQRLFDNVIQPLFFRVPPEEAQEKLPRYFSFLVNLSLIYQLPLIVFTAIYHQDLVQVIFGGKFLAYSWLLPVVIAFATSDWVFSLPIHLIAQYKEIPGLILKSQVVALYQFVAMLVLVPLIGLTGAAIASGTYHVFRNGYVWWNVRREAVWNNAGPALLSAAITWGLCAVLCFLLRDMLDWQPIVEMIVGGAICGAALLWHLRSPAITESDRQIFANVMHGKEGRLLQWSGLMPRTRS